MPYSLITLVALGAGVQRMRRYAKTRENRVENLRRVHRHRVAPRGQLGHDVAASDGTRHDHAASLHVRRRLKEGQEHARKRFVSKIPSVERL